MKIFDKINKPLEKIGLFRRIEKILGTERANRIYIFLIESMILCYPFMIFFNVAKGLYFDTIWSIAGWVAAIWLLIKYRRKK